MKIGISKVLLILVFVFFLATRFYKIAQIPDSVYWDEASIGYNAFSIGTDLKDEWGETLPLHFRAFGEFKLPVYIYSVVPFVKIFGLNSFAVRLPAVFYSLGSIFLVYLLVKKITNKQSVGVLSSFLLSVSPWFFIFSRTGYEAIAGLFFVLLGTYFILMSDKRKIFFLLGTLAFILSFFSYNSFRIIGPILLSILTIITFKKNKLVVIALSAVIFLISLVPVYRLYKFDTGASRFAQVGVSDTGQIAKNYFANFSFNFLFTDGDTNPRSQIPGQGELYYLDIPLVILGLIYVFSSKKKLSYLPILMLILAPIPAALTKESPHALRAILAAPAFAMISAFGISYLTGIFKKHSGFVYPSIIILYLLFFESYFGLFLNDYQRLSANDWQYQYKEIFLRKTSGVITDEYGQPYIFALFYQRYSPVEFRKTVQYNPPDKWGFSLVSSFGGFEFRK